MTSSISHGAAGTPQTGTRLLTAFNARLSRYSMYLVVAGLLAIIGIVAWQVFGRYVLNQSPTWTENLALVLILYVTLVGAAVGVRESGHIGLESVIVLLPERLRLAPQIAIHAIVSAFAAAMVYNGWLLGTSVMAYRIPNLGLSEGARYVPLAVSGVLIILFSIEQVIALLRGEDVVPAWN